MSFRALVRGHPSYPDYSGRHEIHAVGSGRRIGPRDGGRFACASYAHVRRRAYEANRVEAQQAHLPAASQKTQGIWRANPAADREETRAEENESNWRRKHPHPRRHRQTQIECRSRAQSQSQPRMAPRPPRLRRRPSLNSQPLDPPSSRESSGVPAHPHRVPHSNYRIQPALPRRRSRQQSLAHEAAPCARTVAHALVSCG